MDFKEMDSAKIGSVLVLGLVSCMVVSTVQKKRVANFEASESPACIVLLAGMKTPGMYAAHLGYVDTSTYQDATDTPHKGLVIALHLETVTGNFLIGKTPECVCP